MRLHDVSKTIEGDANVLSDEQLVKLQKLLLMMLEELKEICDKNNLKFVLIGGTGIGAIRHKGFIPWDDDADIAMTRRDYETLLKIIRTEYQEKYIISDARDTENYGKIIPKLRLNGTKYRTVLDAENENPGIRLDIFIIENTYDNCLMRNIHGIFCMLLGFALSCRRLYQGKERYAKLSNSMSFKAKAFIGFLFSFTSIEKWAYWTDRCYAACRNDKSEFVTVPSDGPHYFKGLTRRQSLCETKEVIFEGQIMWVPYGVHDYLTGIYGDYMKIPPKAMQVRGKYITFDPGIYRDEIRKEE